MGASPRRLAEGRYPGAAGELRYGDHRLRLPPAVAALVIAQRDQARAASAIGRGSPGDVAWLFPGGFPGRPARDSLYRGLRDHLHVHMRRARSAALAALAAELPAAVLAQLLDININTAIAWANYAQADWSAYLAARVGFSLTLSPQLAPDVRKHGELGSSW